METSLKTGFAQIFSRCPKYLSCPNFGVAAAPLAPPARTPMSLPVYFKSVRKWKNVKNKTKQNKTNRPNNCATTVNVKQTC